MPTNTDGSHDERYLAKFTADEVGADIETHGHIAVTPETATQNPFTIKGAVAIALDDAIEEPDETVKGFHDNNAVHTPDLPHQKDLSELSGDIEGVEEGTRMGEDRAVDVKDSLAEALDSIAEDAVPTPDEVPEEGVEEVNGKPISAITGKPGDDKAPEIPESMGGEEKTDENGLVYITRVFTVDPENYISNNYRPKTSTQKVMTAKDVAKQSQKNRMPQTEDAEKSSEQPDEPTEQQEAEAAKEADNVDVEVKEEVTEKETKDEALESVVLDYATYLDGTSFLCCDDVSGIDYSTIAMDAGPRKKVTRENCETTFAQCRAKNPLFCRYHGPKLLEADIKRAITATLASKNGREGAYGFAISVTKDKDAKNPMTFRLTVGCSPKQKKIVENIIDQYFNNNPGITSKDGMHQIGEKDYTQEFDMDILLADQPPKKKDELGQYLLDTGRARRNVRPVQETPRKVERAIAAANGEEDLPEQGKEETEPSDQEMGTDKTEVENEPREEPKEEQTEEIRKTEPATEEVPTKEEPGEKDEPETVTSEPTEEEKNQEEEPTKEDEPSEEVEPQEEGMTEESKGDGEKNEMEDAIRSAAVELSEGTKHTPDSVEKDIRDRLEGKKAVTQPVLDFVKGRLGEDNPIYKELNALKGLGTVSPEVESAEKAAKSALATSSSPKIAEAANRVIGAVDKVRANTQIAAEIQDKIDATKEPVSGAGSVLANAAAKMAIEEANGEVEKGKADIEKAVGNLDKQKGADYREAEKKAKGEAAAIVERSLMAMAVETFPKGSGSDKVSEEADKVVSEVNEYANGKGLDYSISKQLSDALEAVKKDESRLQDLVSQFGEAMNKTGSDFQADDIGYWANAVAKAARKVQTDFAVLKGIASYDKIQIDKTQKLNDEKKVLEGDEKGTTGKDTAKESPKVNPHDRIAKAYKEWVEEEVPGWAKRLSYEEAEKYAGLLERAMNEGGDPNSTAIDDLNKYEDRFKVEAEKEKEERERKKKEVSDDKKELLAATKRLGVNAYKSDIELNKMKAMAKKHLNDPRWAQIAKDIDAVMAYRKAFSEKSNDVQQEEPQKQEDEQTEDDRNGEGGEVNKTEQNELLRDDRRETSSIWKMSREEMMNLGDKIDSIPEEEVGKFVADFFIPDSEITEKQKSGVREVERKDAEPEDEEVKNATTRNIAVWLGKLTAQYPNMRNMLNRTFLFRRRLKNARRVPVYGLTSYWPTAKTENILTFGYREDRTYGEKGNPPRTISCSEPTLELANRATFFHELGHVYDTHPEYKAKFDSAVRKSKGREWRENVSIRAYTLRGELIAECFALITSERYKAGMLPKPIEEFFYNDVFGING